jgi:hypothetical protein
MEYNAEDHAKMKEKLINGKISGHGKQACGSVF